MSFNRLSYDNCAYKKTVEESTGTLSYVINPIKYENCSKCRVEFGVVGGTNVSHDKSKLVDIENELMNITRKNSKCPSKKYAPTCSKASKDDNGLPCGPYQLAEKHLKPCSIVKYKPRVEGPGYQLNFPLCSHDKK
jgi:hypothetical protein